MINIIKIMLPSALAFILGAMYGSRLRFTGSALSVIIIGIVLSFLLGTYPYYTIYYSALPSTFSEVLFMSLLGALYGSTKAKNDRTDAPAG